MNTLSMKLLLGLSVLAIAACGDDSSPGNGSGSDSTGTNGTTSNGTTSSPGTTSGSSGQAVTSSTGTPGSTGNDSTGTPGSSGSSGSSGSNGSSGSSGSNGSSSSGGPADCVDSDIGSVIGAAVETGSNVGAGDDVTADCGAPGSEEYVVSWTAPAAGIYTFSLEGSSFDTTLALIGATCDGPTLGCNDDCVGLASSLVVDASLGEVVLIAIEGYDGRTGDFTLGIFEGDVEECEFGGSGDSGVAESGVAFIEPPPP